MSTEFLLIACVEQRRGELSDEEVSYGEFTLFRICLYFDMTSNEAGHKWGQAVRAPLPAPIFVQLMRQFALDDCSTVTKITKGLRSRSLSPQKPLGYV